MVECDDVTRIRSENVPWTLPRESNTESDPTIPAIVPTEPTTASPKSPSIVESGTDAEGDMLRNTSSELTDSAVEQSSSDSAKTYRKRSRNLVERYEPTW